jgi:PAS domain S-box-containing protein
MREEQVTQNIFLLLSDLSQLKNREDILFAFLSGINALPADFSVQLLPADQPASPTTIKIATARNFFGDLALSGSGAEAMRPLLEQAARLLAVILENCTQPSAWEDEANQAVVELAETLHGSLTVDEIAALVLERAQRLTGSKFGYVGYIDPQTGYLVSPTISRDIWDICQVAGKDIIFKEFTGLWGWVLKSRQPLLTNSPAEDPRSSGTPSGHIPIERFLSAPALIDEDRLVGQIALCNPDRDYTEQDLRFVERLASLYAIALQRKWNEEALRESKERYQMLFEGMMDGYALHEIICDPQGCPLDYRFLEINQAFEAYTGLNREKVVGKTVLELLPATEPYWIATYGRVALTGEPLKFENYSQGVGGKWFEVLAFSPAPKQFVTIFHDVTERKQTEESLRRSEERFRSYFDLGLIGMAITSLEKEWLEVNGRLCDMLGYPCDELLRQTWADLTYPDDLAADEAQFERALAGEIDGYTLDKRFIHKQNRIIYTTISTRCFRREDGTVDHFLTLIQEITERVLAEQEIRRRNQELVLLNQIIATSAIGRDPKGILETVCFELTQAFEVAVTTAALFDEKKTEARVVAEYMALDRPSQLNEIISVQDNPAFQYLLGHKAPLVVHDIAHDPRIAPLQVVMHQRETVSLLLLPLVIKGEVVGSLSLEAAEAHHFSNYKVNLAWSVADQVAGALGWARLDQERRRLSTAIEQAAESIMITNAEGIILYVNPTFERISGYRKAEAIGQTPALLKSGRHPPAFYQELWQTVKAGRVWQGRIINKKKDGTLFTEEVTISPVHDESRQIVNYVGLKRDVTHELELEKQYQHAQKMEAVGRLAGGVAHDFNNLLTAIMSYAGLALIRLSADDPVYKDLKGIQSTARRAANLTRQLLTFARRQITDPQPLNLNDLIVDMDKMLGRLISEDIELTTLPAPDLGLVKADPSQMEQVLVNLVVNARDAMPDGGRLTIQTANVTLGQSYIAHHAEVKPGEYVMLAVSDTGIGMTDEVKVHIFEPFFTTKEIGKGTGLGLATCFGIVKQSGGHIWVYSEVGQGTTFRIYLPRLEETTAVKSLPDRLEDLPRGTETIFLVEDESAVRELATRTLRSQGYQVLSAINGEAALRLLQEQPKLKPHLLITDVVMPRLGGKALVDALKPTRPSLKLLFISGYTDNAVVHNGILDAHIPFLQKPFSPLELARKVREVLDQR